MKLRRLSFLIAAVMIVTLTLAGSASADPPKEDFYFKWGPADYDLWTSAGGEDFCPVQTGNAWHSECGVWPWYVVGSTNPMISGIYIWRVQTLNGFYDPEWGFWPQPQMRGTWTIQSENTADYWEGTYEVVDNWQGEYGHTISKMVGHGHGAFAGWLLKGDYYFDGVEPGSSPYGDFWPAVSGVLIHTGKAE